MAWLVSMKESGRIYRLATQKRTDLLITLNLPSYLSTPIFGIAERRIQQRCIKLEGFGRSAI
ncbi:hypothetical protein A4V15_22075 [Pseudomonas oryzihabitans]|uniref:Uncharacterized protein n=1 Tax=Pseudomonas oryzihabitans TaxID=47885 RepID=A0A178LD58_9PSED|nr:hypothetical protein A4V15_22075 [Pseudomonas oryzihabitans]